MDKSNSTVTCEQVHLEWTDFKSISDLVKTEDSKPGIYLCAFLIDKKYIPYYIGRTQNIFERINEHLRSILSGIYTIYHKDVLKDFKCHKPKPKNHELTQGLIYYPTWPDSFNSFLDRREELKEHIDFMIKTFVVSYAFIDNDMRSYLPDIEKICIINADIDNLSNTQCGTPSVNIEVIHGGNVTAQSLLRKRVTK